MGIYSRIRNGTSWNFRLVGHLLPAALLTATAQASADSPETCAKDLAPVWIEGGQFLMGSNQTYREETNATRMTVSGFWIDPTEVTVAEFETFVGETGYVTVAERGLDDDEVDEAMLKAHPEYRELMAPGGAVFKPDPDSSLRNANWWAFTPGANWRYPHGPDEKAAKPSHPVTQISYQDAAEYAAWAGGRLPSEAEWEYAALGGRSNADFGAAPPSNANTWQGIFPLVNTADDGFTDVAPVGCFAPNQNGLYDMLGNVWEWTADLYLPHHASDRRSSDDLPVDDSGDTKTSKPTSRVIKGGSFLCAANYCRRYRPAARQPQETGLGTNHIGFRVAYDHSPRTEPPSGH